MVFSAGTTSRRERWMASSVAASSARLACASASSDAALAPASLFALQQRGGDAVRAPPSRMMRAPLLQRGAVAGSCLTVLGVDVEDRYPDLDADLEDTELEEPDAIQRGIQELPRRRESVGRGAGGISRTGSFPRSMCSRTNSSVLPGALHQRRRLAALLRAGGGGGPS
jgi:hypothetical protein